MPTEAFGMQLSQRVGVTGIVGGQRLHQPRLMERLTSIPVGRRERGGKTATGNAQKIVQAGGRWHTLRWKAIQGDREQRDEEHTHRYTLHEQWDYEHPDACIGRVLCPHEVGNAEDPESSSRKRTRVIPANQTPYERRNQYSRNTARCGYQARPRRSVAELRLLPKGHEYYIP